MIRASTLVTRCTNAGSDILIWVSIKFPNKIAFVSVMKFTFDKVAHCSLKNFIESISKELLTDPAFLEAVTPLRKEFPG
jgi:hypothetical protein